MYNETMIKVSKWLIKNMQTFGTSIFSILCAADTVWSGLKILRFSTEPLFTADKNVCSFPLLGERQICHFL